MAAIRSVLPLLLLLPCCLLQVSTLTPGSYVDDSPKIHSPVSYGYHFGPKKTQSEASEEAEETVIVEVDDLGSIKGRVLKSSLLNRPFHAFHSIRYALQPVRFQHSEVFTGPLTDDLRVYDATRFRDICPQKSLVVPVITGSEDCLYISVYSPAENLTDLPVMVFIHGGAYVTGEAQLYMPTKLLDKDVVVAVMQYRLGTLGFLYSGTAEAPGNMGLMDQINALRWVQRYISNWGGDPGLVTLFGQSAGAASTSLLQLSPLVKDGGAGYDQLAHQFVPMSGSAFEYWTLEHDSGNSFRKQAAAVGCRYDTLQPAEMVGCMQEQTLDDVVWGSLKVYRDDRLDGGLGFIGQVPVVQSALVGVNDELVVIPDEPTTLVAAGEYLMVPTMTGTVRDEGSLLAGLMYEGYLVPHEISTNDSSFLQNDLFPLIAKSFGIDDTNNAVPNAFRLGFMPPQLALGDWDTMIGGLVDLAGMLAFKSGMWTMVHEMYKSNDRNNVTVDEAPIFVYSFEFEAEESLFDWIFIDDPDIPIEAGVGHADDLTYLFDMPACYDARCMEMVRRHTILFTNFATYGDPTPDEEAETEGQWSEFMPKWTHFSVDAPHLAVISDDITIELDFPTRWNYNQYGYDRSSSPSSQPEGETADRQGADQAAAADPTSSYQAATAVLSVVAACAVVALCATVVWHKRQMRRQHDALVGSDNVAMDSYLAENIVFSAHRLQS